MLPNVTTKRNGNGNEFIYSAFSMYIHVETGEQVFLYISCMCTFKKVSVLETCFSCWLLFRDSGLFVSQSGFELSMLFRYNKLLPH